jgi:hypothetical protein
VTDIGVGVEDPYATQDFSDALRAQAGELMSGVHFKKMGNLHFMAVTNGEVSGASMRLVMGSGVSRDMKHIGNGVYDIDGQLPSENGCLSYHFELVQGGSAVQRFPASNELNFGNQCKSLFTGSSSSSITVDLPQLQAQEAPQAQQAPQQQTPQVQQAPQQEEDLPALGASEADGSDEEDSDVVTPAAVPQVVSSNALTAEDKADAEKKAEEVYDLISDVIADSDNAVETAEQLLDESAGSEDVATNSAQSGSAAGVAEESAAGVVNGLGNNTTVADNGLGNSTTVSGNGTNTDPMNDSSANSDQGAQESGNNNDGDEFDNNSDLGAKENEGQGSNTKYVIGGCVGAAALVLVVAGTLTMRQRRRRQSAAAADVASMNRSSYGNGQNRMTYGSAHPYMV